MFIYTYILYYYTYSYVLIVHCFTINHETVCTVIYRWMQNYSTRSCLSFGYKWKVTTATSEVSNFFLYKILIVSSFNDPSLQKFTTNRGYMLMHFSECTWKIFFKPKANCKIMIRILLTKLRIKTDWKLKIKQMLFN